MNALESNLSDSAITDTREAPRSRQRKNQRPLKGYLVEGITLQDDTYPSSEDLEWYCREIIAQLDA